MSSFQLYSRCGRAPRGSYTILRWVLGRVCLFVSWMDWNWMREKKTGSKRFRSLVEKWPNARRMILNICKQTCLITTGYGYDTEAAGNVAASEQEKGISAALGIHTHTDTYNASTQFQCWGRTFFCASPNDCTLTLFIPSAGHRTLMHYVAPNIRDMCWAEHIFCVLLLDSLKKKSAIRAKFVALLGTLLDALNW